MKNRSFILALFLCLGLLVPAAPPSLHAAPRKKKPAKTAAVSSRKKEPVRKRIIPATRTEDEAPKPVALAPIDPNVPPQVAAKSVIVVNARTGEVLYEKDADAPRQVASTTKLMTALIVAEAGNLNSIVEVEPIDTVCEPTKLYFKPGERYVRHSLLYALLVHSCNDVARALARDNAGSIENFANRMNARAAALGAQDTVFVNPNGLPSPGQDQHSTARDLSRIARVAYRNPVLRPIMATPHLQFQMADGKTREYANTNKVLQRFPLCNGMKTGYTDAAGHCLVSSADDSTNAVISVCLGDTRAIWNDSHRLLAWGLANAAARAGQPVAPAAAPVSSQPVPGDARASWTTLSRPN